MKVIKRDGSVVQYESKKVLNAIAAAMKEVEGFVDLECAKKIEETVRNESRTLEVEEIQDIVEMELMTIYPSIAKAYILYRAKRDEVRKAGWELTELQKKIYESKYRYKKETFDRFIDRVSGGNEEVGKIIKDQDFAFGGRILAGRGLSEKGRKITLSNCYVQPQPEDNLESIFDAAKYMGRTYSFGGGVGLDLSLLRPAGARVNNAALTTSGPVSFMNLYDTTTAVIGQKGRRGALMLSMSTDHPDINEFIESKSNMDSINHANISVRTTDSFFRQDSSEKVDTLNLLARKNWESAEPGILYWDRIESWHLLSEHPDYKIVGVNPCGEQPLIGFGNCLLGSINLSNFVLNPHTDKAEIDHERLAKVVHTSIEGLNEVLHEGIPLHPLEEQRQTANDFRQVGLGIMGAADLFIKLGVAYGSAESLKISGTLGQLIRDEAIRKSAELTEVYGKYPKFNFEHVKKSAYFKSLPIDIRELIEEKGMANSHVLSIAPTGL